MLVWSYEKYIHTGIITLYLTSLICHYFFSKYIFSFLLPLTNLTQKEKQNWFYLVLSLLPSSKQSRKKSFNYFSTLGLIASNKNIKQNIEENIVVLVLRNFNASSVKTIL